MVLHYLKCCLYILMMFIIVWMYLVILKLKGFYTLHIKDPYKWSQAIKKNTKNCKCLF
jgi:hypothetical protein